MTRKPRVLFCGESSFLSTGYAVYTKNILQRLHATNKYEIAEFGIFGHNNDPHAQGIQWRFYGNLPDQNNEEQHNAYNADHLNKFGKWRFDQVALDFQADFIAEIRDVFMVPFEVDSPFRDFYHLAFMPAVDAFPQNDEWLAHYTQCDSILNYCQWGADQLKLQCKHNTVNLRGIASPAADETAFFPIPDKKGLRDHYGLEEDIFIVGTVMRSQLRKRYSELFQAFASFLSKAPPEIAKKSYLYCHTSYPDMGWHFPTLLKDFGLSSRVLFTYKCENKDCGHLSPSFFQEARAVCPKCKQGSMKTPSSRNGLDPRELGQVYNLFDFYVQYATCFAKGTEVLLKQGWTPIEQVKVGDMAFTHKNRWNKVNQTFVNPNKGNLKTIKVHADYESITVTDDHPIYAIKKQTNSKISLREYIGNCLREDREIPTPDFYEVSNLSPGDLIVLPIDDRVFDINTIDLWDELDENYRDGYKISEEFIQHIYSKKNHRLLEIDNDFCELLGLIVADGCVSCNNIQITCHIDQLDRQDIAMKGLGRLSLAEPRIYSYKDRKAVTVVLSSKMHSIIFEKWIKKGVNKQFPDFVEHLPIEKQRFLLKGLYLGDGHWEPKGNTSVLMLSSKKIVDQVKTMLRRMRINFNCRYVDRSDSADGKNRTNAYRMEVYGNILKGEFFPNRTTNTRNLYLDGYHYMQIKCIEDDPYQDTTHNFEVEGDNTYVTRIGAVHNCEGFGLPVGEAASCAVPVACVDYSSMEDFKNTLGAYPIRVKDYWREAQTGRFFAMGDRDHFVDILIKFFTQPKVLREKKRLETLTKYKQNYSWDKAAAVWMNVIDNVELRDPRQTWLSPPRIHMPPTEVPGNLPANELVNWAFTNVLGRPDLAHSYLALRIIHDLNQGFTLVGDGNVHGFGPKEALDFLYNKRKIWNDAEQARINILRQKGLIK